MYNNQKGDPMKNIISITDKIKERKISKIPKVFDLDDVYYYFNLIEDYLKELKELSKEEKYYNLCLDEEFKLLSNIYQSFMNILFDYYNNFDEYEESERVLFEFLTELEKICKNIEVIKENEENSKEEYELNDVIKYSNKIEYKLNELYELSLKDKKYWVECTNGQRKILIMIYSSFFDILKIEYENFDKTESNNKILAKFLTQLFLICDDFVEISLIKKNIDKNILKYENKKLEN